MVSNSYGSPLWITALRPGRFLTLKEGRPDSCRAVKFSSAAPKEARAPRTTGFMYRIRADGTGLQKALEAPVLMVNDVSPDGKWLVAWAPLHGDGPPASQASSLDGG